METDHRYLQTAVTTKESIKTVNLKEKEFMRGVTDKYIRAIGKKD